MHRNSNFFLVPNEVFILGLDHGELSVYLYLLYCEDRATYQCHPSYNTIGEAIGMSKKTVQKYVRSLENKHLISTEYTAITTKDGRTRNGSLLYTILPMKDALQYYYETKFREIADEKLRRKIEEKLRRFNIDLWCFRGEIKKQSPIESKNSFRAICERMWGEEIIIQKMLLIIEKCMKIHLFTSKSLVRFCCRKKGHGCKATVHRSQQPAMRAVSTVVSIWKKWVANGA